MNRPHFIGCACLFAITLAWAAASAPAWAAAAQVTGSATYRERIALPPTATFEAVLQDVSRMDAPAVEIGRSVMENPGAPPFEFAIEYDPAVIDPAHTYAVRATVRVDGALRFTSDTVHRVLTGDAPDHVEILMVAVPQTEPAAGGNAAPEAFRGLVAYGAEDALFTDCASGREYLILPDGDFAALEHAYLAAGREPGLPMVATFEGRIVKDADPISVRVERFVGVWPDETCAPAPVEVALTDTYWKLLRLGDTEILPGEDRREAHMMLLSEDESFSGTVGCNQLVGGFTREEDRLSFSAMASTMMACQPPLDVWETAFSNALAETAHWRIDGTTLELFDAAGVSLARFEAIAAE